MKNTTTSTCGTSFFSDTILTSIEQLEKINLFPSCEQNDGKDKTNFEFDCETEQGELFTIYDWKEYRPIERDEMIEFHIGAFTKQVSERAKQELTEALRIKESSHEETWDLLKIEVDTITEKWKEKIYELIPKIDDFCTQSKVSFMIDKINDLVNLMNEIEETI